MKRAKHRRPNPYKYFDHVTIDAPEYAFARRIISVPRKTVFTNIAAEPSAPSIKLTCYDDDLFDYVI